LIFKFLDSNLEDNRNLHKAKMFPDKVDHTQHYGEGEGWFRPIRLQLGVIFALKLQRK
jgi:hypothetical protein